MGSAAVGRGIALALSLLFVGVAGGNAGHALAGLEGHGFGFALLATDAMSGASDSAPPHDATNCLLCRAARVSSVFVNTSTACTLDIAGERGAKSPPGASTNYAMRCRPDVARAPPPRLVV